MPPNFKRSIIETLVLGLVLVFLLLIAKSCHADDILTADDPIEVNCIVGEASGEGISGMLAVAEALRNRGNTIGVYGCYAKHIRHESLDTMDLARWAWMISKYPGYYPDLVKGANSWGTKQDIIINNMDENCTETAHIGRHYFFKC